MQSIKKLIKQLLCPHEPREFKDVTVGRGYDSKVVQVAVSGTTCLHNCGKVYK